MNRQEQLYNLKQLMYFVESGKTVDSGGIRKNPTESYHCKNIAKKELQVLFKEGPLLIGLSSDLPKPNSFLTNDETPTPILATRDDKGQFHAFLNICQHRGTRLVNTKKGIKKTLNCPFHAWGYNTTGELKSVPKSDMFGQIDKSCFNLIELDAIEKYGLLWVHPSPGKTIDLDKSLADLAPELATWNLQDAVFVGEQTLHGDLNWKLANDTFGEAYHFNILHKNTVGKFLMANVQTYRIYGQHHRMVFATQDLMALLNKPESQWNYTDHTITTYYLFPNVQLVISANFIEMVRIYPHPDDPGKCFCYQTTYAYKHDINGKNISKQEIEQRIQFFSDLIRDEDYAIAETAQKSLETGALEYFIFGRNEPALHHYHNTFRNALDMPLIPLEEV